MDLVHILINILVESHMTFNWEIKSTFDSTYDRPAGLDLNTTSFSVKVKASWSVCHMYYQMSMLSSMLDLMDLIGPIGGPAFIYRLDQLGP